MVYFVRIKHFLLYNFADTWNFLYFCGCKLEISSIFAEMQHPAVPLQNLNIVQQRKRGRDRRRNPAAFSHREACHPLGRAAALSTGIRPKWVSPSPSASSRSSSTELMEYRESARDQSIILCSVSSSGSAAREAAEILT